MKNKIFRIATTFGKPYSILLGFSKNRLYLISISFNSFSEDTTLLKLQTLFSYSNTISMNFLVKILKSLEFTIMINIMEFVSKRIYFIPAHITITIKRIVRLFLHYI